MENFYAKYFQVIGFNLLLANCSMITTPDEQNNMQNY